MENVIVNSKLQNFSLLMTRVVVAVIFFFAGWAKFSFWTTTPEGFPAGMIILIKFLSIVEPLGALALVIGFLTRWAAAGLAIIMIGSIFVLSFTMNTNFFTTPQGLGWDYNLLLLTCCTALLSFGAGKWSVDRMMKLRG